MKTFGIILLAGDVAFGALIYSATRQPSMDKPGWYHDAMRKAVHLPPSDHGDVEDK